MSLFEINYLFFSNQVIFIFLFVIKKYVALHKKWIFPLRIWSHLLKKSLMENFIFCAVFITVLAALWRSKVKLVLYPAFSNSLLETLRTYTVLAIVFIVGEIKSIMLMVWKIKHAVVYLHEIVAVDNHHALSHFHVNCKNSFFITF